MKKIIASAIALGALALLPACSQETKQETSEAASAVGDDIENITEDADTAASEAADAIDEAADNAADKVEAAADKAGDKIDAAAEKAKEKAGAALEKAGEAADKAGEKLQK